MTPTEAIARARARITPPEIVVATPVNTYHAMLAILEATASYFEGRERWNMEGYSKHDAVIDALEAFAKAVEDAK